MRYSPPAFTNASLTTPHARRADNAPARRGLRGLFGAAKRAPSSETANILEALGPRAVFLDHFPAIELYRAFDFAVAGVGYNTSHELLHAGVPGAYIPFPRVVDDQGARARWIAESGAGLALTTPDKASIGAALARLSDPGERSAMGKRGQKLVPESGADRAAQVILELGASS